MPTARLPTVMNKFAYVLGWGGAGLCTVRPKLNNFKHVWGFGPERWSVGGGGYRDHPLAVNRQTDRHAQLKTLPSYNFVVGR